MNSSRFYLCAVPRPVWKDVNNQYAVEIVRLTSDALRSERRIAKEVNLDVEYSRYTLACQRLEQEIIRSQRMQQIESTLEFWRELQADHFPTLTLHPGYLSLLSQANLTKGPERLGASFFTPDMIRNHRQEFEAWVRREELFDSVVVKERLAFLEWVERADCGLVEVQTGFHLGAEGNSDPVPLHRHTSSVDAQYDSLEIPEIETTGLASEFFGVGRKLHLANLLREKIHNALASGEPMDFTAVAPHDVVTQVLHEFVFVPPGTTAQPIRLRIAYADGSEGESFPLFCLPRAGEPLLDIPNPLHAGLISMRHSEMDSTVDFYWFRNHDVSRARTLAEADRFCFDATRTQIVDGLRSGDLHLHLYQTGIMPAVLGFYRGIVEELLGHQYEDSSLSVTPFYFRGGDNYQKGHVWQR